MAFHLALTTQTSRGLGSEHCLFKHEYNLSTGSKSLEAFYLAIVSPLLGKTAYRALLLLSILHNYPVH
jgi:hypothetical protein